LPVPLSPVINTVALELAMVETKRRKACAMGLVPMKNDCDFMRCRLSLMPCCWQVAKSIRTSKDLFFKEDHQAVDS
jgi:hypothetical protein